MTTAYDWEHLQNILRERLKPRRFKHSLGVAETAAFLARRFNVDENKAKAAGLLHDCAREYRVDNMVAEAKKRGLACDDIDLAMPLLLHAPIGACRIKEIYGIDDTEIAQAISRHTIGGSNMTPLDQIIYFADMIEPSRDYPGVSELRRLSHEAALDEMLLVGLSESIIFVVQQGHLVHPDTVLARNELLLRKKAAP